MDPLPLVDHRAAVVFSIAVGLFVLLQAGTGVVAAVQRRRARAEHVGRDRGTLPLVILFAAISFFAAFLCALRVQGATIGSGPIRWLVFDLGILVIVAGAALRLWAILTLGRWFTYDVRITEGQPIITTGPYRWLRHPSYTGAFLLLLGIGLALGNWLSLLFLAALSIIGLIRRIRVEEAALSATLGSAYTDYAANKSHLIPGIW